MAFRRFFYAKSIFLSSMKRHFYAHEKTSIEWRCKWTCREVCNRKGSSHTHTYTLKAGCFVVHCNPETHANIFGKPFENRIQDDVDKTKKVENFDIWTFTIHMVCVYFKWPDYCVCAAPPTNSILFRRSYGRCVCKCAYCMKYLCLLSHVHTHQETCKSIYSNGMKNARNGFSHMYYVTWMDKTSDTSHSNGKADDNVTASG